jgi:hypothetical protein
MKASLEGGGLNACGSQRQTIRAEASAGCESRHAGGFPSASISPLS